MLNFSLYVSGTLLKGCHLVERILGLPVISSAMISIIILICKYIPLRTEQFDSLCVAQTILFKKRKKDMKFSVLIRQHILHEIGLHRVCTRLKKIKTTEPLYNVQGDSMYSILSIDAILTLTYFFNITKVHKTSIIIIPKCTKHKKHQLLNRSSSVTTLWTSLEYSLVASPSDAIIVRCKAALVFTVSRKSSIRSNIS